MIPQTIVQFVSLYILKSDEQIDSYGPVFYSEIGRSKHVDRHKKEFLDELEKIMRCSVIVLGMESFGAIVPIFFSGPLQSKSASYRHRAVHARTDLAVFAHDFTTTAESLWLVENRAVVTRLAATERFLENTNGLVIGLDGHMGEAHRSLVHTLLEGASSIK